MAGRGWVGGARGRSRSRNTEERRMTKYQASIIPVNLLSLTFTEAEPDRPSLPREPKNHPEKKQHEEATFFTKAPDKFSPAEERYEDRGDGA